MAGWTESDASFAVLGIDIEALGAAVARHWGLGEEMLHMIRRLPKDLPVRMPDTDIDVLRITASAANEVVDAMEASAGATGRDSAERAADGIEPVASLVKPGARRPAPRTSVAQRYARSLGLTPRLVDEALAAARVALRTGQPIQTGSARADEASPDAQPAAAAG